MTEIRYCAKCGKAIPRTTHMGPKGYAQRRYCSRSCNSKAIPGSIKVTKTSGQKNDWQKGAQDTWRRAISRKNGQAPEGTYFESIEEYQKRGGKITQCPDGGAEGALYLSRAHVGGMGG